MRNYPGNERRQWFAFWNLFCLYLDSVSPASSMELFVCLTVCHGYIQMVLWSCLFAYVSAMVISVGSESCQFTLASATVISGRLCLWSCCSVWCTYKTADHETAEAQTADHKTAEAHDGRSTKRQKAQNGRSSKQQRHKKPRGTTRQKPQNRRSSKQQCYKTA